VELITIVKWRMRRRRSRSETKIATAQEGLAGTSQSQEKPNGEPYLSSDAGGGTWYGWSPSSGTQNPLFLSPIRAGQTIEATLSPDVPAPPYDNASAVGATLTTGIYFVLGRFAGVESSVTWRDWRW